MPSFHSSFSSESELVHDLWDERGNLRIDVLRGASRFAPRGFEEDFVADLFAMVSDLTRSGNSRTQIAREVLIQVRAEIQPWEDRSAFRAEDPQSFAGASTPGGGGGNNKRVAPTGEPSDEELLSNYRQGDKAAFTGLVRRYQRELYHFLARFLGNRASAEDVFQETFLQVGQSADQFDPQRRFRPWLFTIAVNKAGDLIRSQARRPINPLQATISPGDEESGEYIDLMQSTNEVPSDPMEKQELQELVQQTVTAMHDHLREILLLSYFHQFPHKQISEILDIPLGTVKSRLHRAIEEFASWLGGGSVRRLADGPPKPRKLRLSEEDRRAADLLLDRRASPDYAIADLSVGQRISRLVALLHCLDALPVIEPPSDLVARTFEFAERTGQTSHGFGTPSRPASGAYQRETPFN